jgi:tRNA (guanine-N7-)-methyltransferase
MAKKKLKRFAEVATFSNTFQHMPTSPVLEDFKLKGKWRAEYFKNENPIILELGCGRGEYTVGLASVFPHNNYIGIDLKGARIWKGAKEALEKGLTNVAFLRARVDKIEKLFAPGEASEIWITFPDPQLQKPKEHKRLTSPDFIEKYKNILKPGGIIHLKTDNRPFYDYTLDVIEKLNLELIFATSNLYENSHQFHFPEGLLSIRTFYENMFMQKGFPICYCQFRLP